MVCPILLVGIKSEIFSRAVNKGALIFGVSNPFQRCGCTIHIFMIKFCTWSPIYSICHSWITIIVSEDTIRMGITYNRSTTIAIGPCWPFYHTIPSSTLAYSHSVTFNCPNQTAFRTITIGVIEGPGSETVGYNKCDIRITLSNQSTIICITSNYATRRITINDCCRISACY